MGRLLGGIARHLRADVDCWREQPIALAIQYWRNGDFAAETLRKFPVRVFPVKLTARRLLDRVSSAQLDEQRSAAIGESMGCRPADRKVRGSRCPDDAGRL